MSLLPTNQSRLLICLLAAVLTPAPTASATSVDETSRFETAGISLGMSLAEVERRLAALNLPASERIELPPESVGCLDDNSSTRCVSYRSSPLLNITSWRRDDGLSGFQYWYSTELLSVLLSSTDQTAVVIGIYREERVPAGSAGRTQDQMRQEFAAFESKYGPLFTAQNEFYTEPNNSSHMVRLVPGVDDGSERRAFEEGLRSGKYEISQRTYCQLIASRETDSDAVRATCGWGQPAAPFRVLQSEIEGSSTHLENESKLGINDIQRLSSVKEALAAVIEQRAFIISIFDYEHLSGDIRFVNEPPPPAPSVKY